MQFSHRGRAVHRLISTIALLVAGGCVRAPAVTQSSWATYANAQYGYTIDYPKEVLIRTVAKDGGTVQIIADSDQPFILTARSEYLPGDVLYFLDMSSTGQRRIGDNVWSEYSLPDGYCDGLDCSPPIYALQTELDGILFVVSFYGQDTITELQEAMLATFRLAE